MIRNTVIGGLVPATAFFLGVMAAISSYHLREVSTFWMLFAQVLWLLFTWLGVCATVELAREEE